MRVYVRVGVCVCRILPWSSGTCYSMEATILGVPIINQVGLRNRETETERNLKDQMFQRITLVEVFVRWLWGFCGFRYWTDCKLVGGCVFKDLKDLPVVGVLSIGAFCFSFLRVFFRITSTLQIGQSQCRLRIFLLRRKKKECV